MPGVFPAETKDGMNLLDGGIVWKNDMQDGVNACRERGFKDEDIIVDWVMCAESNLVEKEDMSKWHSLKHGMRALNVQHFYKVMADV